MKHLNTISIILFSLLFISCEEDEVKNHRGKIQFNTVYGDDVINNTTKFDNGDNKATLTMAKIYLSNVRVEKSDGTFEQVQDYVLLNLIPAFGENLNDAINVQLCECDFRAIHFDVGIDSAQNAKDPSLYELDDVLSASQNMYWNWNSGYIFHKFEGTASNPPLNTQWYVHTGLNQFFIEDVRVQRSFKPTVEGFVVGVNIDINTLVNGGSYSIDLTDNAYSHTMDNEELARQITENLSQAFK